ncbi:MAG: tRNA isopentenyl-2-thiomethyl-A-37 hydroxylase MiaE, partial [Gemmataceae bacterium]
LPMRTRSPLALGHIDLADPVALLNDHAFLEMKAAQNAMDLMTRWPNAWLPGWVEALTSVARDEAAHLAQVTRVLIKRGGRLVRSHKAAYPRALRARVRNGGGEELLDRLCVSALIEARSCERFGILRDHLPDRDLADFFGSLYESEARHHGTYVRLACHLAPREVVRERLEELARQEAEIMARGDDLPRMHS